MSKERIEQAQQKLQEVKTKPDLKEQYKELKRTLELRKQGGLSEAELALFQKQVDEILTLRLKHEKPADRVEMVRDSDNFRRIAKRLKKKLNIDRTEDEIREALIRENEDRLKQVSPTGTRLTYEELLKDTPKRLARLSEEFKKEIVLHRGDVVVIPKELLEVERASHTYTVTADDVQKLKGKGRSSALRALAERIKQHNPDETYGLATQDLAADLERQIPADQKIEAGRAIAIPESGRRMQRQAEKAREAASAEVGIDVAQAESRISAEAAQQTAARIERGGSLETVRRETTQARAQEIRGNTQHAATAMVREFLRGSDTFKRMAHIAENIALDENDIREIFGIKMHTREGLIGLIATGDDSKDIERFKNQFRPRTIEDDTVQAFISKHADKPNEVVDFLTDSGTASVIGTMLSSAIMSIAASSPTLSVVVIAKLGEIDIGIRTGHFETIRERDLQFLAELMRLTEELKKTKKETPEHAAALENLEKLVNWGNRERYKELTQAIEKRKNLRAEGRFREARHYDQVIARLMDKEDDAHRFIDLSQELYEAEQQRDIEKIRTLDAMIGRRIEKYHGKETTVGPAQEPDRTLIMQHILQSERFRKKLQAELAKGTTVIGALAEGGFSPEERELLRALDLNEAELTTGIEAELQSIREGTTFKEEKTGELNREYRSIWARLPIISIFTEEGRTEGFEANLQKAREKVEHMLQEYEQKHKPKLDAYKAKNLEQLVRTGNIDELRKQTQGVLKDIAETMEWANIDPYIRDNADKLIRNLSVAAQIRSRYAGRNPDEPLTMYDPASPSGERTIKVGDMMRGSEEAIAKQCNDLKNLAQAYYDGNPYRRRLNRYDDLETQVQARDRMSEEAKLQIGLLTRAVEFDDLVEKISAGKEIPAEQLKNIRAVADILHEVGTALPQNLDMIDIEGMIQNGTLHPRTKTLFESIETQQKTALDDAQKAMELALRLTQSPDDKTAQRQFRDVLKKLQQARAAIKKTAGEIQTLNNRTPEQIQIAWNETRYQGLLRSHQRLMDKDASRMSEEERAAYIEELHTMDAALRISRALAESTGAESLHIPIDPDMFHNADEAKAFGALVAELAEERAFQSWDNFQKAMKKRGAALKVWRTPATTGRFAMANAPQEITLASGAKVTIRPQLLNALHAFLPSRTDKERPEEKPPILVTMQRALAKVGIYVSYGELLDAIASAKNLTKEEIQKQYGSTINTGVNYFPEDGKNTVFPLEAGQEITLTRTIFLPQTPEEKKRGHTKKLTVTYNILFREKCFNVNIPNEHMIRAELEERNILTPEERRLLDAGEIPFVSFVPKLIPLYAGWQVARYQSAGRTTQPQPPQPKERIVEGGGGGPGMPPTAPGGETMLPGGGAPAGAPI